MISFRANQIVSGLALTIFAGATGLSSYLGNDLGLGDPPARHSFATLDVFGLAVDADRRPDPVPPERAGVRVVGLRGGRGRVPGADEAGPQLRAVGHAPASADAMGISVTALPLRPHARGRRVRGVGGACFSLAITPQWVDGLTQGAGWIAIALVIFAFWRAELCLVGAYLFGAFSSLGFTLQARGVTIAPEFLNALPYVMTIAVLVAVSSRGAKRRLGAPAALGVPYAREER